MSDKDLDKLFNKKLEGFKATPSQEAWEKVQSNINPEATNWKFYLAIAASLLLVGVVTFMMFKSSENSSQLPASEAIAAQDSVESVVPEVQRYEEVASTEPEPEEVEPNDSSHLTKRSEPAKTQLAKLESNTNSRSETASTKSEKVDSIKVIENNPLESQMLIANLQPVSSIDKTMSAAEQTPINFRGEKVIIEENKTKAESQRGISLKKVIDIAREFKTDNQSWSTLREAKNELLTLGRKKNESSDD